MSAPADPAKPTPPPESDRLAALRALQVLDTPAEPMFDDLTWLAASLCQTPIALVSLVDEERQWFKARVGLDLPQASRHVALCAYALEHGGLLEVSDLSADARFVDNPLVVGEPHMRFYAGAPLVGSGGHVYGALCVIDMVPRQLTETQREGLLRLAMRTTGALETRSVLHHAEAREQTLERLLESMPDAVVTCDAQGQLGQFNRQARAWHGLDPAKVPQAQWARHFDLFQADGRTPLSTDQIPLVRALSGEHVQEAEIVILAAGQPSRSVLCNGDPLRAPDGSLLGAVVVMHDITRLRASQEAALVEGQRFREAFSAAAQGMALVSLEGRWLDVNDAVCALFGYTRNELMRLDFQRLTHPQDLDVDLNLLDELLRGERTSYQLDKRYFHRDGHVLHAHLSVSLIRDAHGAPLHLVSQIQDFTQQRQAESALRESEQRLRTITDNVPALVARVGQDLRYEFVNRHYAHWLGRPSDDVIGRHMDEVLAPEHFASLLPHVDAALAGQTAEFDLDVVDRHGELRHMHAIYVPDAAPRAPGDAQRAGFLLTVHDVTAQTRLSRMLQERALTDPLTGLPNRLAWMVELDIALARARTTGEPLAVLFIDLDGFKPINDTYGHETGDAVLCGFGERLRQTLRPEDFAARLAGDEFVVLLHHVHDASDPEAVVRRLEYAMQAPLLANTHALQVTPSIGASVQYGPHYDIAALMRAADVAMYQVKRAHAVRT
ncbi:TPA: diguanylate cyclase [Pseudomonas aeruginosa]|nr:diguanylate cyclase [Pseudomonas aeruginosa]